MIIDAMDILYSGKVEGFCLVSSDSDFTRLAARLRESGMTVIGMGESKTPNSFIAACNKFKYLDILSAADEEEGEEELGKRSSQKKAPAKKSAPQKKAEKEQKADKEQKDSRGKRPRSLWRNPAPACAPSAGPCAPSCGRTLTRTTGSSWGRWGNILDKRYPDFDVRNFGFSKLTPFLESLDMFDIQSMKKDGKQLPPDVHPPAVRKGEGHHETVYGQREPPPAAEEDHRPGAGYRQDGGRGRALRGHPLPHQRGQVRPEQSRPGGAGRAHQALRERRHRARGRGQDHREFYQGGRALRQLQ